MPLAHRHRPCREADVGVHKAESAAAACRALNSSIVVETHLEGLTPANAGGGLMCKQQRLRASHCGPSPRGHANCPSPFTH
jgi:hypothetical protein